MRSRTITLALMTLLAVGVLASATEAAPLPTGTWGCSSNGFAANFVIGAVSPAGVLTATFSGNTVIGGYDSNTNRITFIRQGTGDRSTDQTYAGHMFSIANTPAPTQTEFILAGYFIAFSGTGATAARPEYGWACALVQ